MSFDLFSQIFEFFSPKTKWKMKKRIFNSNLESSHFLFLISFPSRSTSILHQFNNMRVSLLFGSIKRGTSLDVRPIRIGSGFHVELGSLLEQESDNTNVVEGSSVSGKVDGWEDGENVSHHILINLIKMERKFIPEKPMELSTALMSAPLLKRNSQIS